MAGGNDLVDEGWPVVRPLLLQYRDENQVQLVEQGTLVLQGLLGARTL